MSPNQKSFNTPVTSSLSNIFTQNRFTDVTLVSDEQIQFQAHRFVLSACSPVLKTLLQNNPHSHPLIYLEGVKQQELQSILHLMYLGEVKVSEEAINTFLEIAKDLKLNQISQFAPETILKMKCEPSPQG